MKLITNCNQIKSAAAEMPPTEQKLELAVNTKRRYIIDSSFRETRVISLLFDKEVSITKYIQYIHKCY